MVIKELFPLDQLLQQRARLSARKTFIKFEGANFSFQEMDRLAGVYAAYLLGQGLKRGDRAALLSQNNPYYVAAYFGIIRAGGIVLPLNNLLTHEEIDFILNDAGAQTCFFDRECSGTVDKLRGKSSRSYVLLDDVASSAGNAVPVVPTPAHGVEDISTILYTSGTTGSPKGALLTHRNIMANALACAAAIHISPKDRFVVFLPLFHSFTFTVCVVIPLVTGSLISLLPSVRPFSRVVKRLILDRITLFVAIPTVYKILAEKNMPFLVKLLLNLRLCVSGAAPLPVKVIQDFEAAFKVPLLEGYGLTEASPVVSINPDDHGRRRPGTVGLPLPGIEVRVVDDEGKPLATGVPGELLVKGPNVMTGYLNRPEDTAKTIRENWLYTGDIAALDGDGYIKIIDRKKDMIIVDGLNVYPFEVEEVLYRHSAVKDCAMIGVLHGGDKEIPIMYVVLKDGHQVTPKAFREFLSEHVAHYKIPRRFLMIDELPRTATGKILKKEIRKMYLATEMKTTG
ncbi:MAG: hypothetical protein A2X58_13465 [Nitrospirae bacterium GWC2_56_14]|nr:MAG: hypothetical protein A2X58_13465 [Nitrospirae bacterium GWC2_56_14]